MKLFGKAPPGSRWIHEAKHDGYRLVIAGYIPNSENDRAVGALVLGHWEAGKFDQVGKVGTGRSTKLAVELAAALETIRQATTPFATPIPRNMYVGARVQPTVTVDINYRRWSDEGLLRYPSFEGVAAPA